MDVLRETKCNNSKTMKLLIAIFLVFAYTSCTLSVSPDGTRIYRADPKTAAIIAAQIIEVENAK